MWTVPTATGLGGARPRGGPPDSPPPLPAGPRHQPRERSGHGTLVGTRRPERDGVGPPGSGRGPPRLRRWAAEQRAPRHPDVLAPDRRDRGKGPGDDRAVGPLLR